MADTITSTEPLRLGSEPFGVGGRRLCFTHPHALDRCVKILRQDEGRAIRSRKSGIIPARYRRTYDNNAHERQVLDALYKRLGEQMSQHLPRGYGAVETDRGPGLVFDLYRDFDGKISRSLRELLSTGYSLDRFRPAFEELAAFFVEHTVLSRSLLDHNIVVRDRGDGTWRMYVIDGLGDPAWLPLARWFKSLGQAKVRRRIEEAWERFREFEQRGGVTPELLASSSWGQGFLNHRG